MKTSNFIAAAVLAISAFGLHASVFAADDGSAWAERRALLSRKGMEAKAVIGFFPGSNTDPDAKVFTTRLLPVANFLSEKSGMKVSISPERNVPWFKRTIANRTYDFIYVTPEIAVTAVEAGYVPIAKQEANLVSMLLTQKSAPVSSMKDLVGRRVVSLPHVAITTVAQGAVAQADLTGKVAIELAPVPKQDDMLPLVDSGYAIGAVMRDIVAKKIMSDNPDKYKAAFTFGEMPGFMFLARNDVSPDKLSRMTTATLALRYSEETAPILNAIFPGFKGNFVPSVAADLNSTRDMLVALEKKTGAKHIVRAPDAKVAEASAAASSSK